MFSRTLRAGTLAVALAATTVVNPYATAIATPTDSVSAAVTTEASTDLDAAVRDAAEKQQAYDAALVRLSTVKTEQAQAIKDAEARLAALEDEFNAAEAADSAKADELRADRARLIALEQERQAQGDYAGARCPSAGLEALRRARLPPLRDQGSRHPLPPGPQESAN